MTDLQALKRQCDLRLIVEADLGPSPMRGGQALLWRCPFHQERRGYSLVVWPDNWRCFGACQTGGDLLDWLQRYRGLTFVEACDFLGGEDVTLTHRASRAQIPSSAIHPIAEPPDDAWQRAAWRLVERAEEKLWSQLGAPGRDYLHRRHLEDKTMQRARLGYVPGRHTEWRHFGHLKVPCGLLIPWIAEEAIWALKVRRLDGPVKYTQVASGSAQGLYNADSLEMHTTALFVEGEFDALLAEQECAGIVGVATLGSASASLNPHWLPLLLHCKTILVAYDADEAGMKGAARLQALTKRARVVQVPWGKDITEFVLKGGNVQQWLNENL